MWNSVLDNCSYIVLGIETSVTQASTLISADVLGELKSQGVCRPSVDALNNHRKSFQLSSMIIS